MSKSITAQFFSVSVTAFFLLLSTSQISAQTPTPTVTPCNLPLEMGDVTDMSIGTTRSVPDGFYYLVGCADDIWGKQLGYIYDDNNIYHEKSHTS